MPDGASPISSYARYYARIIDNDRDVLIGVFLLGSSTPGIRLVSRDNLPSILDGGCTVVTVKFDLASGAFLGGRCNGVS
jgi:hypothetical protein